MNQPLVSIILSNYNGLIHLKECFDSLNNMNYKNVEIIFIDNNSTDDSVKFVRSNYPNVKIIQNEKDFGFAGANTIAASYASGKYIVLLNIDTFVDKNWLIELVKVIESSDKIGIVTSKQIYYYQKDTIYYAGLGANKFLENRRYGDLIKIEDFPDIQMKTFFAEGASLLIRKSIYDKIGLFDPQYYAFSEDLDLSWRVWLYGFDVIYVPTSIMYHKAGGVFGRISPRKIYLMERNILRTLLKNYETKTLVEVLPVFYLKRIGRIIKLMLKLKIRSIDLIFANIKSIFWNIFKIKSLLEDRKFIKGIRKRTDKFIFKLNEEINQIIFQKSHIYYK
ncbi:MAG: glycosyltransferase family 2 protein [Promethearchaeota archaeon]